MKCDQDLCLNFWYDFKKLLWQDELYPWVRCAFSNVLDDYPYGCYLPAAAAKFDICSLEEEEEAEKEQNKVISPSYIYNSNTKKDNIVRLRTLSAW